MKTNKKNIEAGLERVESCMAGLANMKSQAVTRKAKLQDAKAAVHTAQERCDARAEPEPMGNLEQAAVGSPASLWPPIYPALIDSALFVLRARTRPGWRPGRSTTASRPRSTSGGSHSTARSTRRTRASGSSSRSQALMPHPVRADVAMLTGRLSPLAPQHPQPLAAWARPAREPAAVAQVGAHLPDGPFHPGGCRTGRQGRAFVLQDEGL
jgi:hypothetical protein